MRKKWATDKYRFNYLKNKGWAKETLRDYLINYDVQFYKISDDGSRFFYVLTDGEGALRLLKANNHSSWEHYSWWKYSYPRKKKKEVVDTPKTKVVETKRSIDLSYLEASNKG